MFNIQTVRRRKSSLLTGLVAYWALNGNSKDSLRRYDGVDTGITYSTANGKILDGAGFNPSTGDINIVGGASLVFQRTQAFTFSAWVKTSSSGGEKPIYSTEENTPNYVGITMWHASNFASDKLSLFMGDGTNGIGVNGNTNIVTNTWNLLVATYDGSSDASGVRLYVNGAAETLNINQNNLGTTSTVGAATPHIGNRDGGIPWDKSIDEVGVWTRVLTANEVAYLYNRGNGRPYPFAP